MTNAFEVALSEIEFNATKDQEILSQIIRADELCSYINNFLPRQLTNIGHNSERSEDDENEEESSDKRPFDIKFGNTSRAKTIEELHQRIEKLRGKKVNYKEKLLKKGLKNRLKKKQKLEERKQLKNASRKKNSDNDDVEIKEEKHSTEMDMKPNVPKEISLQFNKIITSTEKDNTIRTNDPKRILQQIEKKNEKLKKLEAKGKTDKLREIKTKESWEAAIKKAEGMKLKDNVELLKKSISKIKQRKNKSKKKWEEREKSEKSKKEEAQKKRQENINKKKKERSKKRTKILIKKARILPK